MEKLQETSSGLAGVVARNKQVRLTFDYSCLLCYMAMGMTCRRFPGLFQALIERGEKLSELEVRTEQMNVRAKAFADAAHQLSLKYKDKKWYQV